MGKSINASTNLKRQKTTFSPVLLLLFYLLFFSPVLYSQGTINEYEIFGKDTVHQDNIRKLEHDTMYTIHHDVNGHFEVVRTVDITASFYKLNENGALVLTGMAARRTLTRRYGKFNEDSIVTKKPYPDPGPGFFE